MKTTTMMVAVLTGLALSASAGLLEGWDFDDTSGTALNGVANSGSLGSVWNFGGSSMATDGSGSFVLAGDGGTTTRKLPKKNTTNANVITDDYATPLTGSDTYTLDVAWSAWDLTSATVGDQMNFKALDSDGLLVAAITLDKDTATTVRIRMASANANYRNIYQTGLTGSATTARIDFNLATGNIEYFVDGSSQYEFLGKTFKGDIGGMIFTKGEAVKDTGWSTAASSISIDSMGLSVVPEPATLGLMGIAGLGMLVARRITRR